MKTAEQYIGSSLTAIPDIKAFVKVQGEYSTVDITKDKISKLGIVY